MLLGKQMFEGINTKELTEQIDSRKRCEKKLPLWFDTPLIYYPPKISVEQSSSEITAQFKATLAKGKTLIDLTGGLGVDSYYFEKHGLEVTHCETDRELSNISKHNSKILSAPNIQFYAGDGLNRMVKDSFYDTIYADPSRRVNSQKVFKLRDCRPDIMENLHLFKSRSLRIIIKTSPLLDIQAGLSELGQVNQIYILSVKNDCKELLWVIDTQEKSADTEIVCITFSNNTEFKKYKFILAEERSFTFTQFSKPLNYLYEPDAALMKSGAFKLITRDYQVFKLHPNSHLYTSNEFRNDFMGRKFLVFKIIPYKNFSKENKVKNANIISRNFPLNTAKIKDKHKLKDGGDDFLIFTTDYLGVMIVIHCKKIAL